MGFRRTKRLLESLRAPSAGPLPPDALEQPSSIVLGPRAGTQPSALPPVRIFLGTERAQQRAERIFVWSVEQVRDPARSYEIYLMRDLRGFDRRRWLTGFTNYRFAIPAFAGGVGRAIYNDVDQIYLRDPAQLFDTELGEHGLLCLPARGSKGIDTSVMLLDCERMSSVWTLEEARCGRKKDLLGRLLSAPELVGAIDPEWNARDSEYREGRSRLLHYTILHTQPWRPFPREFVYQHNPVGHVWFALERSADEAGFQLFGAQQPSARFDARLERLRDARSAAGGALPAAVEQRLAALLEEARAQSLLWCGLGSDAGGPPGGLASSASLQVSTCDPLGDRLLLPEASQDVVVAADGLDWVPDEDLPWVLDQLFGCAKRALAIAVNGAQQESAQRDELRALRDGPRDTAWWTERLGAASARHPRIAWLLLSERRAFGRGRRLELRRGGRPLREGPPRVWVLDDGRPGHSAQVRALAEALGWPYEEKRLTFNRLQALHRVHDSLLGATRITLDAERSAPLGPPWPDLVIGAGRRSAPIARWIARLSEGRARTVQLGRKGGHAAEPFSLVVTPFHCGYPPHPNRIETRLPLHPVTSEALDDARASFGPLFGDAPRPHVALLVGGSTGLHELSAETARSMALEARQLAQSAGGSVFAITSRRTRSDAVEALESVLGAGQHVHRWRPDEPSNPYLAYLARADAIVVSGESESMLADALATGQPVYVFPVPERAAGHRTRIRQWIYERSGQSPLNKRGTVRPQQGLEYVCARLIAGGLVEPPRRLELLHESLLQDGFARRLGERLDIDAAQPLPHEAERVAQRVRSLLGYGSGSSTLEVAPRQEHAQGSLPPSRTERLES